MKNLLPVIACIICSVVTKSFAQTEMNEVKYNTMTFVYVDNSEFDEFEVINNDVEDELKKIIGNETDNSKHCFYFIATNDEKRIKQENDPKVLMGNGGFLTKYLSNNSRDAEYFADKDVIRDRFVNYPVKITQQVNVYFFLSSAAIRRLFTDIDLLPTPLVMPQELTQYINLGSNVTLNLKIYINKEVLSIYSEQVIKNQFTFSNQNKFELTIISL